MGATPINSKRVRRQKLDCHIEIRPDGSRELLIEGRPIMGLAEVAEALGVRVQNVDHVPGVPETVTKIRATRIWLGSEVDHFADLRRIRKAAYGR
jgi:hypothetical protein